MDSSPDWTASGLFSPSKARAQQAQAKDWAAVDSWLSKRYSSKRLPSFERNEETLQALLTLATLNENADEQQSLVDRVEKAASQAHSRKAAIGPDCVRELLLERLDGHEHLQALAATVVCLQSPTTDLSTVAASVVDLTDRSFSADQQLRHTEVQLHALVGEQERLRSLLENLNQEIFHSSSENQEQVAAWTRNYKDLRAKIEEYDERLAAGVSTQSPTTLIEDIAQQHKDLEAQETRFLEMNGKVRAFQSLPPDALSARARLEQARDELRTLGVKRDDLFGNLME